MNNHGYRTLEAALAALKAPGAEEPNWLAGLRRAPASFSAAMLQDEAIFLALANHAPAIAPPADLLDRIDAALDLEEPRQAEMAWAEDGQWHERWPGIWENILSADSISGRKSYLLKCEAGALLQPELRSPNTELFLIEGEIVLGDRILMEGDYFVARGEKERASGKTESGCLVLVRH